MSIGTDLVIIDDAPWMRDGACLEADRDLWFPEKGQPTRPAREVCAGCLVRDECLAYALEHDIRAGIWGGLTWPERKALGRSVA